jgi:hypothetical protein
LHLQRSGSSLPAIKKVIGDKYKGKLPTGWERMTSQQLKRLSDKGELVKVKASFKLGEVRSCLADRLPDRFSS